ncbi:hypothetical protein P7C71_g801, partial [Lecanoromycetidae sp. Uapishka_2]
MTTLTGKPISHTGFGMMSMETPVPDSQAFATMRAALNEGCNFWNGGEIYGKPDSNSLQLLNRYFTKYPEDAAKVVLSIKGAAVPGQMKIDGSEKNIRRSIDECLKVLDGKKFLDIFEPARQDASTPLKETMDTMAQYVKDGKIGGIGLSEVTAERIKEAAALHPIAAVEVELSLQTPDILSNDVAKTCGDLNIPVIAYSPLGRGLLTATMTKPSDIDPSDIRHHLPRFSPENMGKNAQLGFEVQKVAKAKQCTPAQVALAWVRSQSGKNGNSTIIPIPGSTTEARAIENNKEVTLTEVELNELDEVMKKNQAALQPHENEMHSTLIILLLLPLLPSITSSGVPLVVSPGLNVSTSPNVTAHLAPCTDLAGSKAPTIPCYNTLDVNSYLVNYNLTSAEVCAPNQSLMGTCLLPTVYGAPGPNCTMMNTAESTWYAVYNVYQVHKFISNWATALNASTSQKAITSAIDPRVPNTATTVMITLINKHGINPHADTALIQMLQLPTQSPQPAFGNTRVRGESSTPSAEQWQVLLGARLQDTLAVVMDDFDGFLSAVGNGTFSTRGLASASDLKKRMEGGSADESVTASSHGTTASSHVSVHSSATASLSGEVVMSRSTVSVRVPASASATPSVHRPVAYDTGP